MEPLDFLYSEQRKISKKVTEKEPEKRAAIIDEQINDTGFHFAGDKFLEEFKKMRKGFLQTQQTYVKVSNRKAEVDEAIDKERILVENAIRREKSHPIKQQEKVANEREFVEKVDKKGGKYIFIFFAVVLAAAAIYAYFTGQI